MVYVVSIVWVDTTFVDYIIYMLHVTVYETFKEIYFTWMYLNTYDGALLWK